MATIYTLTSINNISHDNIHKSLKVYKIVVNEIKKYILFLKLSAKDYKKATGNCK